MMNKAASRTDDMQDHAQGTVIFSEPLPTHSYNPSANMNLPVAGISQVIGAIDQYQKRTGEIFVHLTSAYRKEGAGNISLQAAVNISSYRQAKILLIEVMNRDADFKYDVNITLDDHALNTKRFERADAKPLANFEGSQCYFAALSSPAEQASRWRADKGMVKDILNWARNEYDLVLVYSENASNNNSLSGIVPLIKGTILVIEAERVRAPVARRLKSMIENQGGEILGTVMNKRRYYIPSWVYRIFFKTR